ncbi:MAG: RdgB/HAM1 family non-canonical purine NTP pyrophosphatase, partial [Sphingomonadales bacterium]|nr:RdgB/HAM1 family non-canonical purine NTP pyrophosphatase [Sphingomonadales bacterium]
SEIAELLKPYGVEITSSAQLGLGEPVEDGETFQENAEIKALESAKAAGIPALADDSGLVVPALDGKPGIHSARWAGADKNFNRAMQDVIGELGEKDKSAYFVCVLSLAWPDGHVQSFEGRVHGKLVWPMRGKNGFGYDPIFVADGYTQTFGEMEPHEKHEISHRAEAFKKFIEGSFDNA